MGYNYNDGDAESPIPRMCTPIRVGCQRKWTDVLGKIFSLYYKRYGISKTITDCLRIRSGGGGGSRTRVLRSFHAGFYKFSRKLYVFSGGFGIRPPHSGTPPEVSLTWWRTTSTEPGLDHTLNHVLGQPG